MSGPGHDLGSTRPGRIGLVVAAVLAVLLAAAALVMARRGVVTDVYPPFLPEEQAASITRYSGPWLTGAAAALLGSGLSIMVVVGRSRRHRLAGGPR